MLRHPLRRVAKGGSMLSPNLGHLNEWSKKRPKLGGKKTAYWRLVPLQRSIMRCFGHSVVNRTPAHFRPVSPSVRDADLDAISKLNWAQNWAQRESAHPVASCVRRDKHSSVQRISCRSCARGSVGRSVCPQSRAVGACLADLIRHSHTANTNRLETQCGVGTV